MVVEAVIEIPSGSMNKYEIIKNQKRIKLDRVLPTRLSYPAEYGFIPDTIADDEDPLDILVLSSTTTFPGCVVTARIIGYLDMIDNNQKDEKIIAVIDSDPRLQNINEINDVSSHVRNEIKHFFQNYKFINNNDSVKVLDFHDKDKATNLINKYKINHRYSINI